MSKTLRPRRQADTSGNEKKMEKQTITSWTLTLPTGSKMSGRTDEGRPEQVNTYNAAGNYSGSLPLTAWLEGVDKILAAGGKVETSESTIEI